MKQQPKASELNKKNYSLPLKNEITLCRRDWVARAVDGARGHVAAETALVSLAEPAPRPRLSLVSNGRAR